VTRLPASRTAANGPALREHDELRPWIALLDVTAAASRDPRWARQVPAIADARTAGEPLLSSVVIVMDNRLATTWARRLLSAAAGVATGSERAISVAAARRVDADQVRRLLAGSIAMDPDAVAGVASQIGVGAEALAVVASLVAVPLLQACHATWRQRVPRDWSHGYCPVCGSWPALAEILGLERRRELRCARCGAGWPTDWLRCIYCETRDHRELGALVPERGAETRRAETCGRCRRYLKAVTTLHPADPLDVALQDAATVELDVAAVVHGFTRPETTGYPPKVVVVPGGRRGLGWWRSGSVA
jgi:FdhE protein